MRSLSKLLLAIALLSISQALAEPPLRTVRESTNTASAVLHVLANQASSYRIPPFITGKFAEHLGANIYKGMDAQILANPTMAAVPFSAGGSTPDGITKFASDNQTIDRELARQSKNYGWPDDEVAGLQKSRRDGLATFWTRVGSIEDVVPSPDSGPYGGRAQRLQVKESGQGLAQCTYLPLHRVRDFEFEVLIRSPNVSSFSVSLAPLEAAARNASAHFSGVSNGWQKFTGRLQLEPALSADGAYRFSLIADAPGQFVVHRILLRPVDHVGSADPDIVKLLKESKLPLLRWPGGNFVSAYHWEDGIGPSESRPTVPNYAWAGLEPNLFGTDEFIAFCRAVGCEPMICINAGTGTAEEAARWIEYCNGSPDSPMGKLRAANGHRERFQVKHWEVGNELWGRWQANWSTAAGYADRYLQFAKAMRTADPSVTLYACGAPVLWDKDWNHSLIATLGPQLAAVTDHPLIGGMVKASTEPLNVYRDFMAVPEVLESRWQALREEMTQAGIGSPRLAITELQVFARAGQGAASEPVHLTASNLVSQASQGEAIYDILIYHAALRLAPFVEMVTHSAVVNHGGGLRKQHERVYANPCHYAQSSFAALAEAKLVPVEIECAREKAPMVLPDLRSAVTEAGYGSIDAVAAIDERSLWLSIVHRGSSGAIDLSVVVEGVRGEGEVELRTLAATLPWAANTLDEPQKIKPVESTVKLRDGKLEVHLSPYSFTRVRVPIVK